MIFRVTLLMVMLASLLFSPGVKDDSGFYTFRRDERRCASPMCGGYFIKLVNQSRTRCANNRYQAECYVANIEWGGRAEPQNENAVLRGTLNVRGNRRGRYGVLQVSEVWAPATANQPAGTFYRVNDRGVRCVTAPCETHQGAELNSSGCRNIAGVDLAGAGAPENLLSEAYKAMATPEGLIVSGSHAAVTGPAGQAQTLKATQFYLRAGETTSQKPCMKTGCSGEVCSDEGVITTCIYRPEYDCYKRARCERQANGKCGFTMTPELAECLRRAK